MVLIPGTPRVRTKCHFCIRLESPPVTACHFEIDTNQNAAARWTTQSLLPPAALTEDLDSQQISTQDNCGAAVLLVVPSAGAALLSTCSALPNFWARISRCVSLDLDALILQTATLSSSPNWVAGICSPLQRSSRSQAAPSGPFGPQTVNRSSECTKYQGWDTHRCPSTPTLLHGCSNAHLEIVQAFPCADHLYSCGSGCC